MVTIRQNRKEHSLSVVFSNRNQISLSSRKVYDKLITMTLSSLLIYMNGSNFVVMANLREPNAMFGTGFNYQFFP